MMTKLQANNTVPFGEEFTFENITDKNLNIINEAQSSAVGNNEALIEELQNLTVQKQELEQKIISFQEKLSVCYAKETKLTEELNKYKMTVKKLAESSKQVLALQTKSNKLEESLKTEQEKHKDLRNQLSEAKEKVKYVANKNISLKENITENSSKVQMLNESISQLNEELVKVREQAEKEKSELKEQYKKAYIKKLNAYKESVEKEKAELNENLAGLQKDIELQKSEYTQKIDKSKKNIIAISGKTAKEVISALGTSDTVIDASGKTVNDSNKIYHSIDNLINKS